MTPRSATPTSSARRPCSPCYPDPDPGRIRRSGEQRELPHPYPLHPRAARHDDRLQAGGRHPGTFSRLKEAGAVELKGRHIVVKDLGYIEGLAKVG